MFKGPMSKGNPLHVGCLTKFIYGQNVLSIYFVFVTRECVKY